MLEGDVEEAKELTAVQSQKKIVSNDDTNRGDGYAKAVLTGFWKEVMEMVDF